MKHLVGILVCLLLALPGCGGDTGNAPASLAGTWQFLVLSTGCPELGGVLDNNGGVAAQVFNVSQAGQTVSASFLDQGGSLCSINGVYAPDQFTGRLTVQEQTTGGRVIELAVEGFARIHAGQTQVDGWARVTTDSALLCDGEVIEFCAYIDADGTAPAAIEICPPVDIVFIVDTSGSMEDEAVALCDAIAGVEQQLLDQGLDRIRTTVLGIVNTEEIVEDGAADSPPEGGFFSCLTNTVYRVVGGDGVNHPLVPGNPPPITTYERSPGEFITINPTVLDPGDPESEEFWAPATALIAEHFDWLDPGLEGTIETVKIIVPISDESPQTGRGVCFEVDQLAINNAIAVAVANRVVVSPIIGQEEDRDPCIADLAQQMASQTGGIFTFSTDAGTQLSEFIFDIVVAACEGRPVETPPPPPPPPPPAELTLIAFDRDGNLYTVDPATGTPTEAINTALANTEGNAIGVVSSSTFVPARSELWLGTGGNAECDGCTLVLDIFSGEATILADNTNVTSAHPGLAIDANGNLFGTEGDTDTLLRIDTGPSDTGEAFTVGSFNASNNGNGMTFLGSVLYVASDDDLYTVDPATGAGTLVGAFSFGGFTTAELSGLDRYSINSMTTDASGTIFAILQQGGGGGGAGQREPTYLVTIDPQGPVINKVGQMFLGPIVDPTPIPLDGLAFVPTAFIIEALSD